MREVKILKQPLKNGTSYEPRDFEDSIIDIGVYRENIEFFRHKCSDTWLEELIKESGVSLKEINPKKAKRLLVNAVIKMMEEK